MTPKKAVILALKLSLIAAAFVFIFRPQTFGFNEGLFGEINVVDVLREMRAAGEAGLGWFVLCIALATGVKLLGILSGVMRWKLLLRGQGLYMPFWYMAYLWFMGRFVGLFLPGTLGLDGYRLVESWRYTKEGVKCTTVIAVEKLIGFIALTFLVFLTFPLGFKYLDQVNVVLLGGVLAALLCFVAGSFLLLLNPRMIQILVEVMPVPGFIRNVVNRLGAAVTAYSGHRGTLLLAVFFGILVHVGTCLMYFFTFLAIRAANTSIGDILFVSPLYIYASVITPTISGMGVREIAFGLVLGGGAGHAAAVLGGHLGLWSGEIFPFLLSIPLLLAGGRPRKGAIEADLARLRAETAGAEGGVPHLPAEVVSAYRRGLLATLAAGLFAGALGGWFVGFGEGVWNYRAYGGLTELFMFPWGTFVYGVLFSGVGLGLAAGLVFLYLLFGRLASWTVSFGGAFGGTIAAGGLIIGFWRYKRDVLGGLNPTAEEAAMLLAYAGGAGLMAAALGYLAAAGLARAAGNRPAPLAAGGALSFAALMGAAYVTSHALPVQVARPEFTPPAVPAEGPNILFICIDTLRADYLRMYDPRAEADTPQLDAFLEDAVLFRNSFAQASWTKPSFGTMFTGMYPHCHTAVDKNSSLPDDVDTVAELLQAAGYYTQGFANNPNITRVFNFDQGFTDYVDLRPSLYFGATTSASRMSLYEVLRRVRQIVDRRVLRRPMVVTEFYQPAPVINEAAFDWLDHHAPGPETPFFLFIHYMDPHDPFMDPDSPEGGYARVRAENPDPDIYLEPMRRAYIREIEYVDGYLGALFEGLKARGLYDDLLIVITSDHGEEFCDHDGWWHGKTLYEEQTHVPLLIKLPGNALGGETNIWFARHLDLAQTMLHFAETPASPLMQGQSLFGAGNTFANRNIAYSFAENAFEGNILQAVRNATSKVIVANPDNPRGLAPLEAYDLASDPGEQENLAGRPAFAEQERALLELVDHYLEICEDGVIEPQAPESLSPELLEQLEGLGYLGG